MQMIRHSFLCRLLLYMDISALIVEHLGSCIDVPFIALPPNLMCTLLCVIKYMYMNIMQVYVHVYLHVYLHVYNVYLF
jgi:hypothetical protein